MNENKKIIILDSTDILANKIEEKFKKWNFQDYRIEYHDKLDNLNKKNIGTCIINYNFIKTKEEELRTIQNISDEVILLVDELNSSAYGQAYLKGIPIHYRNSPINSLIFKIVDKNQIYTNKKVFTESKKTDQKNRIISFISSTGGVGKSTLALNTAVHFISKGKKVLFIDFSIFSNTAISLKLKNNNKGLDNLVLELNRKSNGESEINYRNLFLENIKQYKVKKSSLDVLFGDSPIKIEKISSDIIQLIFEEITTLGYDFIVIDTSSDLSERNLAIADLSDEIILCGVPDIASGWKLIKLKEILDHMQISNKCKLVINKYSKKVVFSCKQLEMELNIPLIGIVPYDNEIQHLSNQGKLISLQSNKTNNYIKYIANNISPIFDEKEIKLKKIKV